MESFNITLNDGTTRECVATNCASVPEPTVTHWSAGESIIRIDGGNASDAYTWLIDQCTTSEQRHVIDNGTLHYSDGATVPCSAVASVLASQVSYGTSELTIEVADADMAEIRSLAASEGLSDEQAASFLLARLMRARRKQERMVRMYGKSLFMVGV